MLFIRARVDSSSGSLAMFAAILRSESSGRKPLTARARKLIVALLRAPTHEGVAKHSLRAHHFPRTAEACSLCLLLHFTGRRRFRWGFGPLRLGKANGHGSYKQCYSESFQHDFFLPS
jgi:hypothetical protein